MDLIGASAVLKFVNSESLLGNNGFVAFVPFSHNLKSMSYVLVSIYISIILEALGSSLVLPSTVCTYWNLTLSLPTWAT